MNQSLQYEAPAKRPIEPVIGILKKLGPLLGLALVFGLFSFLRPETYPKWDNIQTMIRQTAVVGTAALGMTMIIVSGGIDLSVGSVVALVSVVVALVLQSGAPQFVAIVLGILAGMACGFVSGNLVIGQVGRVYTVCAAICVMAALNAYNCTSLLIWSVGIAILLAGLTGNELLLKRREFNRTLGIVPFIATLGMMVILRGIAQWLGNNGTINVTTKMWLTTMMLPLPASRLWRIFPAGVWILILLTVFAALMLRYTRFGRHIYAVGSNEQTAKLCGINVDRVKVLVYALGVGFSGVAGVLQFGFMRAGDSTGALGLELNIIAAVVIGGASLNGGEGGVVGSVIGALMMTAVNNGCSKMGWDTYVQMIVTGGIIIIASQADRLRHWKS